MTHTKEELREFRFFRIINALIKRFFKGEEIDLDQLEKLQQEGKIEKVIVLIKEEEGALEVLKTITVNGKEINILKTVNEIRGNKMTELLQKDFIPFGDPEEKNDIVTGLFKEVADTYILPDKELYYQKTKAASRRKYFPGILCFDSYGQKRTCYWRYKINSYRNKISFVQALQPLMPQGTIIVTGRKKITIT